MVSVLLIPLTDEALFLKTQAESSDTERIRSHFPGLFPIHFLLYLPSPDLPFYND